MNKVKELLDYDVVAMIPVRSGSRRVPGKNVQIVGSCSLIERKIQQLRDAGVKTIAVGSDSKEYLEIAKGMGAIPILRDPKACDESQASANEMIADFAKRVSGEFAMWCHCTNPFIYGSIYENAFNVFLQNSINGARYDSLVSVYRVQCHMWNATPRPLNYDPYSLKHTLAKDLEPVFFQDGGIFIQPLEQMKENSYFFGSKPYLYENNYLNSFDINTTDDLDVARLLAPMLDEKFKFNGINSTE
jgi:CMP-N,N'-diacetyllegionaminic acid synthase